MVDQGKEISVFHKTLPSPPPLLPTFTSSVKPFLCTCCPVRGWGGEGSHEDESQVSPPTRPTSSSQQFNSRARSEDWTQYQAKCFASFAFFIPAQESEVAPITSGSSPDWPPLHSQFSILLRAKYVLFFLVGGPGNILQPLWIVILNHKIYSETQCNNIFFYGMPTRNEKSASLSKQFALITSIRANLFIKKKNTTPLVSFIWIYSW